MVSVGSLPTAKQSDVDVHETAASGPCPLRHALGGPGRAAVHGGDDVAGGVGGVTALPLRSPTPTCTRRRRPAVPEVLGTTCAFHVLPPFTVTTTVPELLVGSAPTAQHCDADMHENSPKAGLSRSARSGWLQVVPPLTVATMLPVVKVPSLPTDQQSDADVQRRRPEAQSKVRYALGAPGGAGANRAMTVPLTSEASLPTASQVNAFRAGGAGEGHHFLPTGSST